MPLDLTVFPHSCYSYTYYLDVTRRNASKYQTPKQSTRASPMEKVVHRGWWARSSNNPAAKCRDHGEVLLDMSRKRKKGSCHRLVGGGARYCGGRTPIPRK